MTLLDTNILLHKAPKLTIINCNLIYALLSVLLELTKETYVTYTAVMCISSDHKHFRMLHDNPLELPPVNSINMALHIFNAWLHSVHAVCCKKGY
jgi:hypothetical protein